MDYQPKQGFGGANKSCDRGGILEQVRDAIAVCGPDRSLPPCDGQTGSRAEITAEDAAGMEQSGMRR